MLIKKACLCAFLSICIIFTVSYSSAPAFAVLAPSDISGNRAAAIITYYVESGMAENYADGTFKPDQPVTAEEFFKLLFTFSPIETNIKQPPVFSANGLSNTYYSAFEDSGYLPAFSNQISAPDSLVSVQDATDIISRIGGISSDDLYKTITDRIPSFTDDLSDKTSVLTRAQTLVIFSLVFDAQNADVPLYAEQVAGKSDTVDLQAGALSQSTVPNASDPVAAPQDTAKASFITEVLKLVNEQRVQNGLTELSPFDTVYEAADVRATEAATLFSHSRVNGTSNFTVFSDFSLKYKAAGENLGYGYSTPYELVDAWMNSPTHKANILSENFKYAGIGYYVKSDGMIYCSILFYTPLH